MPDSILHAVARGESVVLDSGVDAFALLARAEAEGMTGLLARAMKGGGDGARQIRVRAGVIAARAEIALEELGRIVAAFERKRIRLLVIKGPILAEQLYGDAALRSFSDLDLVVAEPDAGAGEALLAELGYCDPEPVPRTQLATHRRFNNEANFVHDERQSLVDFHWRFGNAQFPLRLSFDAAWTRRKIVRGVPTLSELDLALLVCSHAARHLWFRLEFLAQIAALTRLTLDWDALEGLAARAGVMRQVGLSFLLAEATLGIQRPPLRRCFERADEVYEEVRKIAGDPARNDAAGRDLFLLFDRRRDVYRALSVGIFVPTHSDWKRTDLPSSAYWFRRLARLGRKYITTK